MTTVAPTSRSPSTCVVNLTSLNFARSVELKHRQVLKLKAIGWSKRYRSMALPPRESTWGHPQTGSHLAQFNFVVVPNVRPLTYQTLWSKRKTVRPLSPHHCRFTNFPELLYSRHRSSHWKQTVSAQLPCRPLMTGPVLSKHRPLG